MKAALRLAVALLPAALVAACNGAKPGTGPIEVKPAPAAFTVPDGPAFYEDVTAASGIDFTYHNGEETTHYAILESLGGGALLIDYDHDGLIDLFLPGGGYYDGPDKKQIKGHPCKMFRNKGNFQFEDVTEKVGLAAGPVFYTHGGAVGDYDNDGWPDLLVTGFGRVVLYHNEPDGAGGRKFVDVTKKAGLLADGVSEEAGQPGRHFWSTSAAFADLDGDGYPEIYVCQYVNWSWKNNQPCHGYTTKVPQDVCPPKQYDARPHALYRNKGDGTFVECLKEAGLRAEPREDRDYGKGLGVLIADVDGDGKPDIYVANDTTDNFLYLNRSTPGHLQFEDRGLELGVARDHNGVPNGSMGVDAADWDGTGRPSIWVTNYENEYNALYRNTPMNGRLSFTFGTNIAGLSVVGPTFVGFGTVFADVDGDGWEDIVVSNGHVVHHPIHNNLKQRPILFLNREGPKSGERKFADARNRGGPFFQEDHRGRGLAVGDLDNDGRPDLVFAQVNEPVRILKNVGTGTHWLGVELAGKGHRDLVGTKLTLEVGGRKQVRFVKGGGSYCSAHDPRKLFGLGDATAVGKLTVDWPSGGGTETFDGLAVDKYHHIEQGKK